MNDDELKSMIENAGDEMPASTKASVASAISAGFQGEAPSHRFTDGASSDAESVVVPLDAGGRTPRRTPKRWIAIGGVVPLAAALIGVFALRNDHDVAEVTDTVPVATTTTVPPVQTATSAVVTEPTGTATTEAATPETATTKTVTTETVTTEPLTTETVTTVGAEQSTTSVVVPPDAPQRPVILPDHVIVSSISFGTDDDGWIVGTTATDPHATFLHTSDRGQHWSTLSVPELLAHDGSTFQIAAGDSANAWLAGTDNAGNSILLATHDGGASWTLVPLSVGGAAEERMYVAAFDGLVHLVTFETPADAGVAGRFRLFTAPVGSDDFVESPVIIEPGAGPVFDARFAFATAADGTASGWFVYNDRGYQAGARLVDGEWVQWESPCVDSGTASLASNADGSTLVVACSPTGFEGTAQPILIHVSHDGGDTFVGTATPPNNSPDPSVGPLPNVAFVAAQSSGIVVGYTGTDGAAAIVRSTDDGATWDVALGVDFVGQLTTIPGQPPLLVVTSDETAGLAIMSADGGATWETVPTVPVG